MDSSLFIIGDLPRSIAPRCVITPAWVGCKAHHEQIQQVQCPARRRRPRFALVWTIGIHGAPFVASADAETGRAWESLPGTSLGRAGGVPPAERCRAPRQGLVPMAQGCHRILAARGGLAAPPEPLHAQPAQEGARGRARPRRCHALRTLQRLGRRPTRKVEPDGARTPLSRRQPAWGYALNVVLTVSSTGTIIRTS